jgi:hypothetical protein
MHHLVKEFLEFRKTIKKNSRQFKRSKRSFCGDKKNSRGRRMGSPYECLKRGYGSSNHTFIKDLDKFFKHIHL